VILEFSGLDPDLKYIGDIDSLSAEQAHG